MRGGDVLDTKTLVLSMGAGMALGATIILMMPRQNSIRRAVQKKADCLGDTLEDSMRCMCR